MNFFLTGEYTAEYGDASGTAYFDVRKRRWSADVLKAIDPDRDLLSCLPALKEADDLAGFVTAKAASFFGIPEGIPVSTGGGDNRITSYNVCYTKLLRIHCRIRRRVRYCLL